MSQTTQPVAPSSPGPDDGGAGEDSAYSVARLRRRRRIALGIGVVLAGLLTAILLPGLLSSKSSDSASVGNTAAGIDQASASLLDLNVISGSASRPAPDFNLVDQNGRPTTLSQFRGKAVVWSLNDDQCTDLCTLLAEDVVAANKDLGAAAKDVVFVSVNANPFYPSPAALKEWSVRNALGGTPNWVYVTGTPAQLQSTWNAYGVTIVQDPKTRTVQHDASVVFIDPSGQERALGYFAQGSISTAYYAHAMAQMAVDLLPKDQRVSVAGPPVDAKSTSGATIGDRAPAFSLPDLDSHRMTSLTGLEAKPLVINFWSTTCSVCEQEMPALQQVDRAFNGQVNFVGVDVADPRGSATAAAFAKRLGVTYPLLDDSQGSAQGAYRVGDLPLTLIVAPDGSIMARHDGGLTAPQLTAVLQEDFDNLPAVPA